MKHLQTLAFVLAFSVASTVVVRAQDTRGALKGVPYHPPVGDSLQTVPNEKEKTQAAAPKAATAPSAVIPLKVQIVIARYQGEKRITSMPYTLTVNAGGHSNLRMGAKIPVVMIMTSQINKDAPVPGPIQYQDVGTNIDCFSTLMEDGRIQLSITIDDSSVYPDEQNQGGAKGNPSFRSFRANNSMVLRNGETGQFTTATDKVTGETVKVDVTLTVLK